MTANEGPATAPIWHHNEYGWSTIHPTYLLFYCLVPAESGGETPLNSSVELAEQLEKEVPEFVQKLKEKVIGGISLSFLWFDSWSIQGGLYAYRYTKDAVLTSNTGASVLDAYGRHVLPSDSPEERKRKVEADIRRHSNRFEWHENGDLTVSHVVPGKFHIHKRRLLSLIVEFQ